jgi:D-galactose 1-dehydrogenase
VIATEAGHDDPIDIAIVGVGKIARDQHLPSIGANPGFRLAATVSRHGGVDGTQNFPSIDELLAERPDIAALALCTPPQVRFEGACKAIRAGRHVLLEKPPGATVSEVEALVAMAKQQGVSLFAAWHSRFAAAVEPARKWLADKAVRRVGIIWKEDVRRWHPGQAWIWEAGGLGVFDPGINALSIVTAILPVKVHLVRSELQFPEGRDAPIAARLAFEGPDRLHVTADFDWRQAGPQTWDIEVDTDRGTLLLTRGGAAMSVDGVSAAAAEDHEYNGIYRRFVELISTSGIEVDLAPLIHVADAFMLGRRLRVERFEM